MIYRTNDIINDGLQKMSKNKKEKIQKKIQKYILKSSKQTLSIILTHNILL